MNKESYSQNQQILMRRLVKRHTIPIYNALQLQMKQAADLIRSKGYVHSPVLDMTILNADLTEAIINLYVDASKRAKKNYRSVKRFEGLLTSLQKLLTI